MSDQPEQPDAVPVSELLANRRAKLERLRAQGIDPFPHDYPGVQAIAVVKEPWDELESGAETEQSYRVAGRLAARRGQGKMAFLDLVDRSGRMQLQARADVLGEERMATLLELDLGDLVGVDGTMFRTRRGELSLRVDDYAVLAKSLRPPPDKHHGLQDVETRFRRRELDLMANEEARETFLTRAKVISTVRRSLDDAGFVEVETPVLQPLYGGALARPFVTHHNALDRDFYLRIATELYLKRCIVGGLERVYELGKDFRNEGISFKHNPEFTMVEWYEAYTDYAGAMARVETVVGEVAEACGYEGDLDFSAPWERITLRDAILRATGVDVLEHRTAQALAAAIAAADGRRPRDRRPQLAAARRRPAQQVRRAEHHGPGVHHRLPEGALAVREGPSHAGGSRRALRGVLLGHGDRQRVHRAQRPRRAAPALRGPEPAGR